MHFRSALLLAVVLTTFCGAAAAQAVGDLVPNKQFLASWAVPAGVDELADYPSLPPTGKVVLLDWWGAT